jgi:exonuclease SbcC
MRLLKLRIRNIASLKGEHEIDFEEIQKESPLFAITGETGSGKSTILNCIALALYGDVYKTNVYQPDVVTLGEKEASIELIFQVKGKNYLADWRIRVLKNNGEKYSKDPTASRLLYTIDGTDFSSSKTVTKTSAENLINLDFKQFCKCIILNQGEFARFLTSTFHERKEILEKLYPGDLLDNLSRELELEKKNLEKERHDLEIELHTLKSDIMPGDELRLKKEKLSHELLSLENTSHHFENLDQHFTSLLYYFDKNQENEKRKSKIKEEISTETTKLNHLLKKSETLQENLFDVKKREEIKIPELQTFLEKESTLRHLEESCQETKKKFHQLTEQVGNLKNKIQDKESEERELSLKLDELEKKFTIPPHELNRLQSKLELLFEIFNQKEIIEGEIKTKKEKLQDIESRGLTLNQEIETLEKLIPPSTETFQERERALLEERTILQVKVNNFQMAKITADELRKQIEALKGEVIFSEAKIKEQETAILQIQEEITPIEITVKLQELSNARETCLEHAIEGQLEACPVCETELRQPRWRDLKNQLTKADAPALRKKLNEKQRLLLKTEQDHAYAKKLLAQGVENLAPKLLEIEKLEKTLKEPPPSLVSIDQEIDFIRKKALESTQLKKEVEQKRMELDKLRSSYKMMREEQLIREHTLNEIEGKLLSVQQETSGILQEVNRETIRLLRQELINLTIFLIQESLLEKVKQEKSHHIERKQDLLIELSAFERKLKEQTEKLTELTNELQKYLGGEKASVLISRITEEKKAAELAWSKHLEEQTKQEQLLTNARGRLFSFEEHAREIDLQFLKEIQAVRECGNLENLREETSAILKKVSRLELNFSSPRELYLPLDQFIKEEKDFYRKTTNQCRMLLAGISEKFEAWEKLQDKIQLREIKLREIRSVHERKLRLFEVIGKDDLRTFVLSLVEETLIQQTNEELQKLYQGRYEIVHQTKAMKMTPEFFILDKFREGGRRKVSTLSGGETFMVSIAMALGLAEMSRGQAEIDSLFIDEGFGTLDQDSLEDVLDMLQQIQTRGLMVGIISHIRPLTEALSVNLLLTKKSDGTSTVSIRHN